MKSLFWRIFFSFWALLIVLAIAMLAVNATFHPHFGLQDIGIVGPPNLRAPDENAPPQDEHPDQLPPPGADNGPPPDRPGQRMPQDDPSRPPDFGGGPPDDGPPPPNDSGRPPQDNRPPRPAQRIVRILDHSGKAGVSRYFSDMETRTGVRFFLFDSNLDLIAGHAPDDTIKSLAERALNSNQMEVSITHSGLMHGDAEHTRDGRTFVIVDEAPPLRIDYPVMILRIVLVVAIASLVCWWLSRQIVQPLRQLRSAADDLAAGRLQTRVVPTIGRRNDELGSLAQGFDSMAQRLETMIGAQNRLLADVSHELRSPLTRLTVASAIARRSADDNTQKSLDRVDKEAERLNEMIGQLTKLSSLEIEQAQTPRQSVDLVQLVSEIVADSEFEAKANGKNVVLKFVASNSVAVVQGDRDLLRSAIENVVRNAVRYTAPNTGVAVAMVLSKDAVTIKIADQGPGVPESQLKDIFRPFYRTAEARDRESGGVGLGLAITDRAIARHGGKVVARNAMKSGLEVEIVIPLVG